MKPLRLVEETTRDQLFIVERNVFVVIKLAVVVAAVPATADPANECSRVERAGARGRLIGTATLPVEKVHRVSDSRDGFFIVRIHLLQEKKQDRSDTTASENKETITVRSSFFSCSFVVARAGRGGAD